MAITRSQQAKQMLQEGGGAKPPKLGNPPVIEEIENMREFRIANPDVKNIFDLEREINRKNKLSPKGLEILLRLLNMENKSSRVGLQGGGRDASSEDFGGGNQGGNGGDARSEFMGAKGKTRTGIGPAIAGGIEGIKTPPKGVQIPQSKVVGIIGNLALNTLGKKFGFLNPLGQMIAVKNLVDSSRQGVVDEEDLQLETTPFAGGGIVNLDTNKLAVKLLADGGFIDDEERQAYGLGSIVRKAKRVVKKVVKSPIGKIAAAAAIAKFGVPLLSKSSVGSFFGKGSFNPLLRKVGEDYAQSKFGSLISSLPNVGIGTAITAASALPLLGLGTGEETEEEAEELIRGAGLNIDDIRESYLSGDQYRARRFKAEGGSMKEPVAKKVMPLLDMDGMEKDYRETGGFVPIGRMEKADDVPARLSKNEFVFTADAVRNAGDGDVDKGSEVMYNMMKNLEAGGEVSEESQGLEGARKMFQTSQRLEEVL
jgi:hypothetical protein|tara:strand:+ start:476 stop:1921 length:1446 start_codon:yes stop_codon:yes gene_type:complete